uniref:Death effector domain-containing 1 n=1 Tax=Neogobius melanostomus TaxID=47308 RepID=A0A8C6SJQ2_9GOBI
MALAHHFWDLHCWEENECLNYYSLLSLHEVYDVVGSQLTETDIEVLSFLLNETSSVPHPLDPAGWTVDVPSAQLLNAWQRLNANAGASSQSLFASHKPRNGLELLLELERRGHISEVLTRHDLLPFVSHKKRRTDQVSVRETVYVLLPEQSTVPDQLLIYAPACSSRFLPSDACPTCPETQEEEGHGWSRKPKKPTKQNVRLRVRAEYLEHESALRNSVSSDKRQPLERQFELFSQANSVLRSRNLGSIVCDIKFTELDNLDAFWTDYLSGALLEALKGVFLTDSLRSAAGSEGVRLLISVDQDDYEHGRRLLQANTLHPGQASRAQPSCSQAQWTV